MSDRLHDLVRQARVPASCRLATHERGDERVIRPVDPAEGRDECIVVEKRAVIDLEDAR
jgi:hypothetical protein